MTPLFRASVLSLAGALAGCAYDWSLPEGTRPGEGAEGASGQQAGGEGGQSAEGGGGGATTDPVRCTADLAGCLRALCEGRQPRKCAADLCAGQSAEACSGLVCGDGALALGCVTQLCVRYDDFCRDRDG